MNRFQGLRRWVRSILIVSAMAFAVGACSDGKDGRDGMDGADGRDGVDTGTINVTVTTGGTPVAGATVTTTPATASVDTDAAGLAVLAATPIGSYDVTVAFAGVEETQTGVNVASGLSTDLAFSVRGVPGAVTGMVLAPDGTPVEGATVSAPGSVDAVTDATGAFTIDAVVSEFLSITPPAGSSLLPGDTRESVAAGDVVSVTLSGGPDAGASYVSSDTCLLCHSDVADAWMSSGHYRVIERSLLEMDTNGWPDDPGAGLCSAWFDTGVDANDPSEDSSSTPSHDAYIRTCNDSPDMRYEMLVDVDDDGATTTDTIVPVYATYGGPGTQAGEIAVLQERGEANDIHGAWKQRYMFSIADLGTCDQSNPDGSALKNAKPTFVTWDTTQTCEDMLIMPIQYNQRTLKWVSYHNDNWYTQGRSYAKKCSGCHEVGITLTAGADGLVTEYAAVDYRVGCEKCHGPGGSHVAGVGDQNKIMNPAHMTVEAAVDVCGQCHSRGSDPIDGAFGFPWRSDSAEFDGNFVAGLHTLDWDAVDAPEGYFLQKPGRWPTGFPAKHRQQYNSYLNSAHVDNPYDKLACNDCHSPHSGRGAPFEFTNADFAGNEFMFGNNANALMSNVRCLSCHASHGPFATLTLDDVAIYHTGRGGAVDKNGEAMAPTPAEQVSAEDLIEQAVKAHSGERAGMPLAPYLPEQSHIPANYELGEGPVGRCTSCHMTKTAKSGTWFDDINGRRIMGDNTDHSFRLVDIQPGTDQPNTCGACHASFRTSSVPPGGD